MTDLAKKKRQRYFKMCEAEEIQAFCANHQDDYVLNKVNRHHGIRRNGFMVSETIWIPHQEDIQKLTGLTTSEFIDRLYWFVCAQFAKPDRVSMNLRLDCDVEEVDRYSVEELTIMFVMFIGFGKKWDNEKSTFILEE